MGNGRPKFEDWRSKLGRARRLKPRLQVAWKTWNINRGLNHSRGPSTCVQHLQNRPRCLECQIPLDKVPNSLKVAIGPNNRIDLALGLAFGTIPIAESPKSKLGSLDCWAAASSA